MCLKRIVQVTQVQLEVNPVVLLLSLSQRINTPLFTESSSINNTIQFSLKVIAHGSCRAVQNMKGHHAHPHIQYTEREGRLEHISTQTRHISSLHVLARL